MERVEYTISGNCHPGASLGQLHNDGNGEHRDRENRIDDWTSNWYGNTDVGKHAVSPESK